MLTLAKIASTIQRNFLLVVPRSYVLYFIGCALHTVYTPSHIQYDAKYCNTAIYCNISKNNTQYGFCPYCCIPSRYTVKTSVGSLVVYRQISTIIMPLYLYGCILVVMLLQHAYCIMHFYCRQTDMYFMSFELVN